MKPFEKRLIAAISLMMILFVWLAASYLDNRFKLAAMGSNTVGAVHLVNDIPIEIDIQGAGPTGNTEALTEKSVRLDGPCLSVTATVYNAVKSQTDSDPYTTASGFKINPKHPEKHRICGLSRDLLKPNGLFDYSDSIRVSGCELMYNGIWIIEDKMGAFTTKKRKEFIDSTWIIIIDSTPIVKTVDFLIGRGMYKDKWKNVKIEKI